MLISQLLSIEPNPYSEKEKCYNENLKTDFSKRKRDNMSNIYTIDFVGMMRGIIKE